MHMRYMQYDLMHYEQVYCTRLARRLMTILMGLASGLTISETKVCFHTLLSEFLLSAQLANLPQQQSPTKIHKNFERLKSGPTCGLAFQPSPLFRNPIRVLSNPRWHSRDHY
jgi:hypothetical protein